MFVESIEPELIETKLIEQAQAGDDEAMESLYSMHAESIKVQLQYLFKGMDDESAEDLAQDTFVRALRGLDNFNEEGYGLRPWLGRIAHNLFVDQYRRANKISIESNEGFIECYSNYEDVEHRAIGRVALEETLECIPDKHKDMMKAICIDGMSIGEYAEKNGVSPASIKSCMYRVRSRLRKLREEDGLIEM